MSIDWMIVKDSYTAKPIGAVGFIDDKIAVITAFFDDLDANKDGTVQFYERASSLFSRSGGAVAEVASHAYADPDILMRDPSLYNLRGKLLVQFATGLLAEGVYTAYFSRAIGMAAGAIGNQISQNAVKSFVIKKGMETAVKAAFKKAMAI
ncbi:MAG: hypothetical protein VR78_03065 [Hoeflea sp. BRH_c9]|nr:MAG: hypothetical protein VR78_03065 [Hoeflea sp. BRH_c9]